MNLLAVWDKKIFLDINAGLSSPALDFIFKALSWTGGWFVAVIAMIFLSGGWRRRLHGTVVMFLFLAMLLPIRTMLKTAVDRPRPVLAFEQQIKTGAVDIHFLDTHSRDNSFPSGHAMLAFFCLTFAGLVNRRFLFPGLILASLIGFSRIYVGAHFPLDCIGGALLGTAGGWLAWKGFLVSEQVLETGSATPEDVKNGSVHQSAISKAWAGWPLSITPVAGIILLALMFYLPGILSHRDFFVTDEARYAEVVREMIHAGNWLVPHLNGQFYADKPPLYFYLAAGISYVTNHIVPFNFMLFTWLAAAGCLVVTYRLGEVIYSRRAAFLGVVLMMSSFLFLLCAQIVRMDMPMAFFITLAMYAFFTGYRQQRARTWYFFYIASALAVMFKGPFGFAIPYTACLGFLAGRRQWHRMRKFVFHPGFILFVILSGSWLVAAWAIGEKEFIRSIFIDQIMGRAIKSSIQRQPFWFYIVLIPLILLPWSPFMIRSLRDGFRDRQKAGTAFLLWWFLAGLAVISAVSGKLFIYVLPMLPPIFLVTGDFFDRLLRREEAARKFKLEGIIAAGFTFGFLGLAPLAALWIPMFKNVPVWPFPVILLPMAGLGVYLSLKQRFKPVLLALIIGMWLFSCGVFQMVMPNFNDVFSAKGIGEAIAARLARKNTVATFHVRRGILNFYASAILPSLSLDELNGYLSAPDHQVILPRKYLNRYRDRIDPEAKDLAEYTVAGTKYLIMGKKAASP